MYGFYSHTRQQNKKFLSQLGETEDGFNIGNFDINTRNLNDVHRADENVDSSSANHLTTESSSYVIMPTLIKIIFDRVKCGVECVRCSRNYST